MRHRYASGYVLGALLLAAVLGGSFGEASARGRALTSGQIEVQLSVEVEEAQSVVAHVIEPGGEQRTLPLTLDGDNLYTGSITLRKADFVVVFEALGEALSTQSQPLRLTELGLDPALLGTQPGTTVTTSEVGVDDDTRQWGWAGLALAALSLALVAWWALPERKPPEVEREPEPEEAASGEI